MADLWGNDGAGWHPLKSSGFPSEAELHDRIQEAPQMLPLSGSPRLTIVGREVRIGNWYADLVAVESTGRIAIIELKLAANSEARQAVIAQVLTYAAFLQGSSLEEVERDVLASHLRIQGHATLADAVRANDQTGDFEVSDFEQGLRESLQSGSFRLVFVLDEAPSQLVRLIGYLEAVTGNALVIDLVSVSSHDVAGYRQILVPQRVDPERANLDADQGASREKRVGVFVQGVEDFIRRIDESPAEHQETLRRLVSWATTLDQEGLLNLNSYHTKQGTMTLLPRVRGTDSGLVTIWNEGKTPSMSFWRSVFERLAPKSMVRVEEVLGKPLGQGNTTQDISESLLDAIAAAYREANSH